MKTKIFTVRSSPNSPIFKKNAVRSSPDPVLIRAHLCHLPLDEGCHIEIKNCRQLHFKKHPNSVKIRQTSGNGCIFTKMFIFSLLINRLKLFYLMPCILPESV